MFNSREHVLNVFFHMHNYLAFIPENGLQIGTKLPIWWQFEPGRKWKTACIITWSELKRPKTGRVKKNWGYFWNNFLKSMFLQDYYENILKLHDIRKLLLTIIWKINLRMKNTFGVSPLAAAPCPPTSLTKLSVVSWPLSLSSSTTRQYSGNFKNTRWTGMWMQELRIS